MASTYGDFRHLLPSNYKRLITSWLEEDCPSFDYGGFVVGDSEGEARLLGKAKGVVAGVPFVDEVFAQLGCTVEWHVQEGEPIEPIKHCATVRGPIRKILLGERVALNILARCSGIATKSASLVAALRTHGWSGTLAGTRKTTPGFRVVEKYGILIGGADPHRHDLSSMTMLKDNHVWACANNRAAKDGAGPASPESVAAAIPRAVQAAKVAGGFATKVEVECRSVEEANAAIEAGADVIMLDNFTPDGVREAAKQLKQGWADKKQSFLIEVSGGLNESNAASYACSDVDIISTSSIHQGVGIVDFSLKVSLR
ncbi:Quinolinate phosphoribosyl transferase C-terminal domain protein [Aspergillus parasiticus SU-1]|uniref:Nicotinate-nucleotide pyrophosphorylase [carboxylating] n=3 Tax=Aspergillus subgen. Circumdati TaxID=2720871 RepID=A0A5N6D7G4_ASPPA|nr:Quinolinate phosphoribosyl transferase [Aspergillus parasiticus]KAE8308733.1 Quinolinate phosphoribosyl transferase [Aspergillus transmontanensis]KJK67677.1 Quinolinate phosphoribosyl transferase C-terminal domain protein [Aspergillus parasiticus SU-1]